MIIFYYYKEGNVISKKPDVIYNTINVDKENERTQHITLETLELIPLM